MSVGPDACERCLGVGDREHLSRRIERDDGIRGVEEKREATRPRTEIEDAFPRSDPSHFDESAQPERADRRILRADGIVVSRPTRIVDRHATCNWLTAYER